MSSWFLNNSKLLIVFSLNLSHLRLVLNAEKNKLMLFSKRKRVPAVFPSLVSAPGISIETVASYKYLGVVIDVNLFLKPQIDYL